MNESIRVILILHLILSFIELNSGTNAQLSEVKSTGQPNIVLILGDDLGWNDFGFHGSSQIPTPNIDALGYNGVILDKFYTQQTCSPSRAALLTGNYPIRSGLQGLPLKGGENRFIPLDMPTLPEQLKKLGYSTHLVGKWHLGYGLKKYTPTGRGFDTHFGYWNGFCGYFNYELTQHTNNGDNFTGFDLHDKFTPQWQHRGEYATELFTKKSLEIIDAHDDSNEKPLFLMIAHLAGHTGKDGVELEVPNNTLAQEKFSYINDTLRRNYAEVVNLLDDSVGRVIRKLSEKNMLENSIIIFLSDNGAQTEGFYQNAGSGWPFRGLKFTLFEGGVRGSAVVYSPLLQKKGYINKQLMHITDLMPTLYHAAGGNVKDLGKIDGINQWEAISKNVSTSRTEILLNIDEVYQQSGLLGYGGQYKLIKGTFLNGSYDQYYGDSGRGPKDPPYDLPSVLNSPANVAIQKMTNRKLDEPKLFKLRAEIDVAPSCNDSDKPDFVCTGFCLFDIYSDPCETTDIKDLKEYGEVFENLRARLEGFFKELVPQQISKETEIESNPALFNNSWYTWLEDDGQKSSSISSLVNYLVLFFSSAIASCFNIFS